MINPNPWHLQVTIDSKEGLAAESDVLVSLLLYRWAKALESYLAVSEPGVSLFLHKLSWLLEVSMS